MLERLPRDIGLCEIRLRSNRPVYLTVGCKTMILSANGGLGGGMLTAFVASQEDVEYSFRAVCKYSVYSFASELASGFVTLEGGHRVGICGTAVYENGAVKTVKYISSLNFRIASERIGCAEEIFTDVMKKKCCGILLTGSPMSAKTTVLRDLARLAGNEYRLSLIDERSELAACSNGLCSNNVGAMTDVLNGYSKRDGFDIALRTMSPQMIFCDEIGGGDDAAAILEASKCGVSVAATAHASSIEEALQRRNIARLARGGAFKYCVNLGSGALIGKITQIEELKNNAEACRSFDDNAVVRGNGSGGFGKAFGEDGKAFSNRAFALRSKNADKVLLNSDV